MRNPKTKKLHKLTPELLTEIFHQGIRLEYQNKVYDDYEPCPRRGNEKSWAYDKEEKIFCKLITKKWIRGHQSYSCKTAMC